jgi:hypothetical protein
MYYWAEKTGVPEKSLILSIIVSTLFFYFILPIILMAISLRLIERSVNQ